MSKLPTVAIVGRTNVGKSSLFNRVVGTQQAIVAQEEGTTRDPVVSRVTHGKHTFWLVDTAGLKSPEDEFEATIQEQITEAAEAADVILVVVEADKYPDDEDRAVAKRALRSKKPVILVTNKIDRAGKLGEDEFRRLGIKTIIQTSAHHNLGIAKLLTAIFAHIPERHAEPDDDTLRIALIGRPNVGKSSLFNTLAGKQQALVANKAGTTRDVGRIRVRYHGREIELLDTAGIRRNGKVEVGIEKFSVLRSIQAIEESDVALLLMDVNELGVAIDQKLAGIIKEAGKGLVLVVTKWDAAEGKDAFTRDALAPQIAGNYEFVPWAPLIFTSAVTGQNVSKLFDLVTEIDERRRQKLKTTELNRMLRKAVETHPPAGFRQRQPKIRYITQTDERPPYFSIFGSDLKFLHWGYRRYLERIFRETFDFNGTPIKLFFRDTKAEKEATTHAAEKPKDS
ncbi:MAG TPA: ribosome biogenesis GTPase Der [Candidatus Saccharimonadales bacterium]|nr:ribosome biogenesis GTPase Der [Candidatus Saccharimonadales bacterium]